MIDNNLPTDISIVITTYNSEKYILGCLESILQFNYKTKFEIIIIDNNSSDNTLKILKELNHTLKIIPNKENYGFSFAANQGIKCAKYSYIFLLNPDTKMINNSINIFYEFMQMAGNEKVWCVGAQLYSKDQSPSKSYGRFPNLFDVILEQIGIKGLILKYLIERNLAHRTLINQVKEVPFIMGCNMFIRSSALESIGLFNEKFFLNFEETELSWRAKKCGYKSIILPHAKIIHYSSRSFTDIVSYWNHLWYGQLLFFKLTSSNITFLTAKLFQLAGARVRHLLKNDKRYIEQFKKIESLNDCFL